MSPSPAKVYPPVVKLMMYGILGGLAGTPVSMTFRDFPHDLLSRLLAKIVRNLPPEQVVEVWSFADLQGLKRKLYKARVVLIFTNQGRIQPSNHLDWLIELRRYGNHPLPTVFSIHHRNSTETPGATLVAQGDDELCNELRQWLQENDSTVLLPNMDFDNALSVDVGPLRKAIQQAPKGKSLSDRDFHIVMGLVTGAVIHELFPADAIVQPIQAPGPNHYAEVNRLLNSRPFHTVDQPYDDLTLHMVARANAYLRFKSNAIAANTKPLGGRTGNTSKCQHDSSATAGSAHDHITRRELVDLGNPHSSASKLLLKAVMQSKDAESAPRMGIKVPDSLPAQLCTGKHSTSQPVTSMTTWTYKMVRTRFDRLRSDGLIEARRAADNAAFEYLIPEELVLGRALFAHLPDPKEVQRIYDLK